MTEQMTTADVLNRAADLIEERGWATGDGWMGTKEAGPLCIEGAIQAAMGVALGPCFNCDAYEAVREHVGQRLLFQWNDHLQFTDDAAMRWIAGTEEKSHEHGRRRVLEVLRATALIAAARERESAEATS